MKLISGDLSKVIAIILSTNNLNFFSVGIWAFILNQMDLSSMNIYYLDNQEFYMVSCTSTSPPVPTISIHSDSGSC